MPIGEAIIGIGGFFLEVNPALCRMLGYGAAELCSLRWVDILEADDGAGRRAVTTALGGPASEAPLELRCSRKDGAIVVTESHVSPISDEEGRPAYVIVHIQDISARRGGEAELEAISASVRALVVHADAARDRLAAALGDGRNPARMTAVHDTGADVRHGHAGASDPSETRRRSTRPVGPGIRRDGPYALMVIAIDELQVVEERFGRTVADAVLTTVARRLGRSLRPDDRVSRRGDDQFLVFAAGIAGDEMARQVSRRLLDAVATPIATQAGSLQVKLSIGVALSNGEDRDELVVHAETARYEAERRGSNQSVLWAPGAIGVDTGDSLTGS